MSKFEIEVGGACTNANEVFVRVVEQIDDGRVLYHDFGLTDGEPIGLGNCELSTFEAWSARPVTEGERWRLRWDKAHAKDRAYLRGLLDRIPDEIIRSEYRRRGLDRARGE
jgi:hypothetical protein